ncbi:MAG: glycosyltransferase [Betaproteobacteria bacterium]
MTSPIAPRASVVVAVNPHENDLSRMLDGYARQCTGSAAFELIVVDAGHRADVADAAARHRARHPASGIRVVRGGARGRAAANNAGIAAARSDLIIIMADDLVPASTLVAAHLAFHESRPGAAAVGVGPGYFTEPLRRDPFRRWLEDSGTLFGIPMRAGRLGWSDTFFYVGNASFSRSLYDDVGRFDERFAHDVWDDFEFGCRLAAHGVRSTFLPKALAWHDHAVDLEERGRAIERAGAAARLCESLHPHIRPWAELVAKPSASYSAAAFEAAARHGRDGTPATLGASFQATLDFFFVSGYENATAGDPTPARDAVVSCAA